MELALLYPETEEMYSETGMMKDRLDILEQTVPSCHQVPLDRKSEIETSFVVYTTVSDRVILLLPKVVGCHDGEV